MRRRDHRTLLSLRLPALVHASTVLLVALAGCGGGTGSPCSSASDCNAGQACVDGTCTAARHPSDAGLCQPGFTLCTGICVDTRFDPTNCGQCGKVCGPDNSCSQGMCLATPDAGVKCPSGFANCGGQCADTRFDPAHCGACANACATGELCIYGGCGPGCPDGQTLCPGAGCVDTGYDEANCGGCGMACGDTEICESGTCLVSPYGDGSDGDATVMVPRTTDMSGAQTVAWGVTMAAAAGDMTVTVAGGDGLAMGQLVLIHQTLGTAATAGTWEFARVDSAATPPLGGNATITLTAPLRHDYAATGAQMVLVKEFGTLHITSAGSLSAPAWDGTTGGILAVGATTEIIVDIGGSIGMGAKGFRGGAAGHQGESYTGMGAGSWSNNATGGGEGSRGSYRYTPCSTIICNRVCYGGGGGGGNGSPGANGGESVSNCTLSIPAGASTGRAGASIPDPSDPTVAFFGGGGGGDAPPPYGTAAGARGGGLIFLAAPRITIDGQVEANGGGTGSGSHVGTGAGGQIYIQTDFVQLGTEVRAVGGGSGGFGGAGAAGRVIIAGPATVWGVSNPYYLYYEP